MRRINFAGLSLLQELEGKSLKAYQDGGGVWTIGYGHTGPEVVEGLEYTDHQAVAMLEKDLEEKVYPFVEYINDTTAFSDNQYSALCCLVFNIGLGNFKNSSLCKNLNEDLHGVYYTTVEQWYATIRRDWEKWVKVKGEYSEGLFKRRQKELDLWNGKV